MKKVISYDWKVKLEKGKVKEKSGGACGGGGASVLTCVPLIGQSRKWGRKERKLDWND